MGRGREIAAVRDALTSTRLLTLTGAGGSGKTRLALEVVTREVSASGEVGTWVELARVHDPALVADAVLTTLGIRGASPAPVVERLARFLGDRPSLLVLDNCEHLVEACTQLVDSLLRAIPHLRVVATSRAALGVAGETAWLVPPLSLERRDTTEEAEAVQLFVQRASAVVPGVDFSGEQRRVIAQVCRRLDGLPLALELAAARLKVLSVEQVAARLDDRFRLLTTGNRAALPRHQTLRAAIDWSHDLLGEPEKLLLARLSVFGESFSLEAVEAVCVGGAVDVGNVLDLLAALVDQSLVQMQAQAGLARYALLETVKEYAAARLTERGEAEERQRMHADLFTSLAIEAEPSMRSPQRAAWIERMQRDADNFRLALGWSSRNDPAMYLRMVAPLHWYWYSTALWTEAQHWLGAALELPEAGPRTRDRGRLLLASGAFAALQARCEPACRDLGEAASIAAELGDGRLLADARNYLGMSLNQAQDPAAEDVLLKAREWLREHNDLYELRLNFLLHGVALMIRGEMSRAVEMTEEGVRVARVFGLDRELAVALQQLAMMVLTQGDRTRAATLARESLECVRRDPQPLFLARALEMLASSTSEVDALAAATLYGAAEGIREPIAAAMWRVDQDLHAPFVNASRRTVGDAAFDAARANGRALGIDAVVELALSAAESAGKPREPDPSTLTGEWQVSLQTPPRRPGLSVRALGPLDVSMDGVPLARKTWGYAKARELLVFLMLHPEGRTREQIGAAIWPDASASQLRNVFHVTVHHLRRALGNPEWVVFEDERYRLGNPASTWLDAAAFEERMLTALRETRRGAPPIDELQALATAYTGDFLDGEPVGDWHLEVRDRLARLHADSLTALGTTLMSVGRHAEAVDAWEALVRREMLHEEGYRGLMRARSRAGDRQGAIREFRRLVSTLRREQAGSPERQTVALLEQLQRGTEV